MSSGRFCEDLTDCTKITIVSKEDGSRLRPSSFFGKTPDGVNYQYPIRSSAVIKIYGISGCRPLIALSAVTPLLPGEEFNICAAFSIPTACTPAADSAFSPT